MKGHMYFALCFIAAMLPMYNQSSATVVADSDFPGWPRTFQGAAIERIPLSDKEIEFLAGFPGKVARFTDGNREILLRWIQSATRKLHPVSDCLKASSYKVAPLPMMRDPGGRLWGCVQAENREQQIKVCEIIMDENDNSWSDASSWYWAILLNKTDGPWWSATVSEQMVESDL